MKRLIFLLISGITALPILAQLNGDGYYRIQNTSNYGRYLTISNNKVDETNKNAIKRGEEGNVYGLKTINDAVSDPSSIVYISKDNTAKSNNAYNIQAQGINPLKFLKDNGAELKIYPEDKGYFLLFLGLHIEAAYPYPCLVVRTASPVGQGGEGQRHQRQCGGGVYEPELCQLAVIEK